MSANQRSGRVEYSAASKKLPESAITLRLKQLNMRRSSVTSIESKELNTAQSVKNCVIKNTMPQSGRTSIIINPKLSIVPKQKLVLRPHISKEAFQRPLSAVMS